MCLYPELIRNKRYTANKKNGGVIPAVPDPRVLYVPIKCSKCLECRKQKSGEWRTRMLEEIRTYTNGIMVTLTFSDESYGAIASEFENIKGYELDNTIATRAVRLFLERWRKKYKKSLRHWLVTELGHEGTENIHMHGIVWTDKPRNEITRIWEYGWTYLGDYVNERTVNYSVKYVTKIDIKHQLYKPLVLCTPGIGANYTKTERSKENKYKQERTNEGYRTRTGHKISLPIYYRNKIYTEEEREELWLQKLNKEERWVMGVRINMKRNAPEYWKALTEARQRSIQLGYGGNMQNWEREKYEHSHRIIMQQTRIQKAMKNAFGGK